MKIPVLFLCVIALSGCAGVADNQGVSILSIFVNKGGAPLTDEPVSVAMGNQRKEAVTDGSGQVRVVFTYGWNSYYWIRPPLGSLPRRSAKPEYLIRVAGREIGVRSDSGATTFDTQKGAWTTAIAIDLKAEPHQP